MRLGYIILAHKNPGQIARLVQALTAPNTEIVIHVDRKVDEAPFRVALDAQGISETIRFLSQRIAVNWGGYSVVRATLAMLRDILQNSSSAPDYVFLLSGQDYPLASNENITAFIEERRGAEFLSYAHMPAPFWSPREMRRIREYQFLDYSWLTGPAYRKGHIALRKPMRFYAVTRLAKYLLPKRRFPAGLEPYAGSMWWGLSRPCLEYVLEFLENRPEIGQFFRHAGFPDEILFHTIVMNSPFADRATDEITGKKMIAPLCYLEWGDLDRPVLFTAKDWDVLRKSGKLFARKFDSEIDPEILQLIDENRTKNS